MSLTTPTKKPRLLKDEIHIVSPESIKFFDKELITPTKTKTPKPIKKEEIEELAIDLSASTTSTPQKAAQADRIEVPTTVKQVYKLLHKATGVLGGNGYNGAIYGELTEGSMQKIVDYLVTECDLKPESRFIDVGSGLGKPNFHALQSPGCCLSFGVELEEIRWILAMHNLNLYLKNLSKQSKNASPVDPVMLNNHNINFICADIDTANSLDPFTHIYMYDLGFPPPLQQSIARKFNASVSPRFLISYRPPHRVIEEYGYSVEHIHQMNTKMFGSGESHMAYFYRRVGKIPNSPILRNQTKVSLTWTERRVDDAQLVGFITEEKKQTVDCDEAFAPAIRTLSNFNELQESVEKIVSDHLNSGRSSRRSSSALVSPRK